jgi:anaerobic ribonucleoside-triphosphate reductase activating protein
MKIHNILNHSVVNGDGIRIVIFFQGCPHRCYNCHNPSTWDISNGTEYTPKDLFNKIDKLIKNDKFIDGLSLSGGEPLIQKDLYKFLQIFKSYYPEKTIWMWTGYTFNKMPNFETLNYIDVVIDGKYKESLKDTKKFWRGSNNQNMYKKVDDKWMQID